MSVNHLNFDNNCRPETTGDLTIMASALASLTANYTDSEGEDEQEDGGRGLHPSLAELNRMVITKDGSRASPNGDVDTPGSSGSSNGAVSPAGSRGATPTKKAKLVSYVDPDAGLSDEESLQSVMISPVVDWFYCRRGNPYPWTSSQKTRTRRTRRAGRTAWRKRWRTRRIHHTVWRNCGREARPSPFALKLKLTDFVSLKEFSCLRSLGENVRGSYRCVDIGILLLNH